MSQHPTDEVDVKDVYKAEAFLNDAQAGNESERKMGLLAALKLYPKAAAWSIGISFAVVMEGYDVVLLNNFYAYPAFTRRFGVLAANGTYQIPAPWQAGLGSGSTAGQILGLLLNGIIAEKFGYRRVMLGALAWMSAMFFLHFFAKNLQMLLAAQILAGVPWGIFQTLTTSYAAEVAPVPLRAFLTTWVNACWGIGKFWMWPVPLAVLAIFAPESPWWLVRKGRLEEAKKSLLRLTSQKQKGTGFDADQTIAMMRHTIESEREATVGASYVDCFRGSNLRRTEIVCGCWAVQQLCGSAFMNYSTYFFQQAGLQVSSSFDFSMGQYAINTGGTFIAWFLIGSGVGRRSLYLGGTVFMFIFLIIIGSVSQATSTSASWASAVMLLCWSVAYQFSVGSVCYSIVSEISSRRLLIKSVNLGRGLYCTIGIVKGIITPYMLNPTAWNWKGKTAFFWAGFNLLCLVWIYFRLPEPRGLTFAQLDALFEHKIPARQFQTANIDSFAEDKARLEAAKQSIHHVEHRQ